MESDYLTMESEGVRELLALIDQTDETLKLADKNYRPLVSLENHLTGSEVCGLLHISLRTLQTLRDRRQICAPPFVVCYHAGSAKILPIFCISRPISCSENLA